MSCCKDTIQAITNVVTILSLFYGVYQYCKYDKNVRIERTMSYNSKFFDTEIIGANKKFMSGDEDKETIERLKLLASNDKDLKEKLVRSFIIEKVQRNEHDWFVLYDFYVSVYQCIKSDLCDKDTLSHSIKSNGLKFFKNFIHYNCKYEANKSDFMDIEILRKVRKYYYPSFKDCNFKSSY
jgi:hypothetical protein